MNALLAMYTETTLNDPIEVNAYFGPAGLRPVAFLWQGRSYKVRAVTFIWDELDGKQRYRCFSVTDGTQLYQLRLNMQAMRWRLSAVATD